MSALSRENTVPHTTCFPSLPPSLGQLSKIEGSHLTCFRNGQSQGVMFNDLLEGFYAPAVSVYYGGKVRFVAADVATGGNAESSH